MHTPLSMEEHVDMEIYTAKGMERTLLALSTVLFNDGLSCRGCYEIQCRAKADPQWCYNLVRQAIPHRTESGSLHSSLSTFPL
jgi:hypothetical protein